MKKEIELPEAGVIKLTHKIVFEVYVEADNMDEALTKARDDVAKFRCHHIDMEVL